MTPEGVHILADVVLRMDAALSAKAEGVGSVPVEPADRAVEAEFIRDLADRAHCPLHVMETIVAMILVRHGTSAQGMRRAAELCRRLYMNAAADAIERLRGEGK